MDTATLYVVATPIGNLDDFSSRAIATLQQVDLIAAEDTRHSKILLERFSIATPLRSYHDFSDARTTELLLSELQSGKSLALISDAGTPLISDPGFRLVKTIRDAGILVIPVPGASALTAALSVAGLPTDRFSFEGFLPAKSGSRRNTLQTLVGETRTLVFYESPHRIADMVSDVADIFGAGRQAFIGRELTKKFETHFTGTLAACCDWLQGDKNQQRGEFVFIVQGQDSDSAEQARFEQAIAWVARLQADLPLKKAVAYACEITGARKNAVYEAAINAKDRQA